MKRRISITISESAGDLWVTNVIASEIAALLDSLNIEWGVEGRQIERTSDETHSSRLEKLANQATVTIRRF